MHRKSWLRQIVRVGVVSPFVALGLEPRQVMRAHLATGVMAALALTAGPAGFPLGAALFAIAIVLDRACDELVDAAPRQSPIETRYAFVSGNLVNALAFAGLGIGLRGGQYGLAAIGMGLAAGLGMVAVAWLIRRLEVIDGRQADEFGGVAGLDAEDVMFLAPLAIWSGWAEGLLLVTAFGAPALASAFGTMHYRKFFPQQ